MENHDLLHVFPEYQEKIVQLKTEDVHFSELFDEAIATGMGVAVIIVNFIAMLELSREALIEITQAEPYAPIYVRLAYSPNT